MMRTLSYVYQWFHVSPNKNLFRQNRFQQSLSLSLGKKRKFLAYLVFDTSMELFVGFLSHEVDNSILHRTAFLKVFHLFITANDSDQSSSRGQEQSQKIE